MNWKVRRKQIQENRARARKASFAATRQLIELQNKIKRGGLQ